jgi:small subunit ribosomal protein S4
VKKQKNQDRIKHALTLAGNRGDSSWIDANTSKMEGTFKSLPERADLPAEINENLIVELYSK